MEGTTKSNSFAKAVSPDKKRLSNELMWLENALMLCDIGAGVIERDGTTDAEQGLGETVVESTEIAPHCHSSSNNDGMASSSSGNIKRKDSIVVDDNYPGATPGQGGSSPDVPTFQWDFGKHIGRTISETPAEYITWVISLKMHDDRPDLLQALVNHGYDVQRQYHNDQIAFDHDLWITPKHAQQYVGVKADDMAATGYWTDERGNFQLVDVLLCAAEGLGYDVQRIACGVDDFLRHIRRSRGD